MHVTHARAPRLLRGVAVVRVLRNGIASRARHMKDALKQRAQTRTVATMQAQKTPRIAAPVRAWQRQASRLRRCLQQCLLRLPGHQRLRNLVLRMEDRPSWGRLVVMAGLS